MPTVALRDRDQKKLIPPVPLGQTFRLAYRTTFTIMYGLEGEPIFFIFRAILTTIVPPKIR